MFSGLKSRLKRSVSINFGSLLNLSSDTEGSSSGRSLKDIRNTVRRRKSLSRAKGKLDGSVKF